MSTSYTHFTTNEREMLLLFSNQGYGIREVDRRLNRLASSISRELRRNGQQDGSYSACEAQKAYQERRKRCVRKRKLDNPALKKHVEEKLLKRWSPEQIDGRLKLKKAKVCISFATIYRAIHSGQLRVPKNCLRCGGRKPSPHREETRGRLHGQKTIRDRPRSVDTRAWFGHWEGDTIRGAQGKGVVATFVDRRSRFLVACLMPDRRAQTLTDAMCTAFARFPMSLKRSFTVDNGNEFFGYQDVEDRLKTQVFFADPYHPWQRGLNENTNGLLRQYFPKKCDFLAISAQDLQAVVDALNHRPRKCLGFRSPAECFPLDRLLHFT